ncbi:hypothetical protein A71_33 [Escherichia phage A7_1]|nr:hypothetical protein A71_33 [Escherichia phage A7_1]
MKYYIYFRRVFGIKTKKLEGYEMKVTLETLDNLEDYDVIPVAPKSEDEYNRFERMLKLVECPIDNISFVKQDPLEIINYLRGQKQDIKRNTNWKEEIKDWSLNLRGERV